MTRAIIIGAGPAGLATAIALSRVGIEPAIFERAGELREVGSGLTLWPNAMHALDAIGAGDAIRAICRPLDGIAMRSWHGEMLDITSGKELKRRYGETGAALHRGELIAALRGLAGEDAISFGAVCIGYRADDGGVRACFADGREERGDLLIGADGLRSVVAQQLLSPLPLRRAGFVVWRAIAAFGPVPPVGVMTLGPGAEFGLFPVTGGRVYWFASATSRERRRTGDRHHKRELLTRFGGWHEPIRTVLEATDEAAIILTEIYDRDPVRGWSSGRVTLVGDAAHPSTPTLGQGACQAIEDAAVLGRCLGENDSIEAALLAYEERRAPRANAMTVQARRMARIGRWESRLACWLRERMFRWMPSSAQRKQLDWLFHFEG